MDKVSQCGRGRPFNRLRLGLAAALSALLLYSTSCAPHGQERIAVIPRTEGIPLWDSSHAGAEAAADRTGASLYWRAPTREDDVEAQISLVDRVAQGNYQGLVLAPDQALSLISPVRLALSHGIPTVIIGSPLPIPPGGNLFYILNDDEEGGRIAALRVASLVHGRGIVAILGIDPDITGIMIRSHAFEKCLADNYPGIQIVERRVGSFNVPHEQQVTEDILKSYPNLDVIVALMSTTVDGALSAISAAPQKRSIKVVGFDSDLLPLIDDGTNLDSVIQEDTRAMGEKAVELIHSKLIGQPVRTATRLQPKLITRENVHSADVRQMFSLDWQFGHWRWSPIR